MPRRIGVFCPTLHVYGGGEFVAIAIANTLAQNNHNVVLFTNQQVNPWGIRDFFGETLHPSIRAIQQPCKFNSRGLADFYQALFQSCIAKTKCDMLIDTFTNCVFPWTDVSYIHYPFLNQQDFRRNFPYLSRPHLLWVGTFPHVLLEKNLADYDRQLVLANSQYTAQEIWAYSQKTAYVLYPPFASRIAEIGRESGKNPRENLVVTISRFESNKCLDRIPQIASKTNADVKFALVGRLYDRATLAALEMQVEKLGLRDRVKFYPDAPADLKFELLRKAKVYLHAMVGEHFGISIVEAMAIGCTPLVHDSGGMKEFVPEHYRYETIEQAAEKINFEIQNWAPQKTLEAQAIADHFSLKNFSERFIEFFEKYKD
jgi:alpha-1,2-mannosyltransferase